MRFIVAVLMLLLAQAQVNASESVFLRRAPGVDTVESNCAACHSLDYIQMNSPFLNSASWDAEITKMIRMFGAPINDADARTIADYLKANYGS